MSSIRLRSAEPADFGWIYPEMEKFGVEYGLKANMCPPWEEACDYFCKAVDDRLAVVSLCQGNGAGVVLGQKAPHCLNSRISVVYMTVLWVLEAYRKSGCGMALVKEFILRAQQSGADMVSVGVGPSCNIPESSFVEAGLAVSDRYYVREFV